MHVACLDTIKTSPWADEKMRERGRDGEMEIGRRGEQIGEGFGVSPDHDQRYQHTPCIRELTVGPSLWSVKSLSISTVSV